MIGVGLVNRAIYKGLQRGLKMKAIKRYLSLSHNIKISHKAFKVRYDRIKKHISEQV